MRNLKITKDALSFIRSLETKQFKQVLSKVFELLGDTTAEDSSALKVHEHLFRDDIGEFRIAYRFDDKTVSILLIVRRNDDEVYKKLSRKDL